MMSDTKKTNDQTKQAENTKELYGFLDKAGNIVRGAGPFLLSAAIGIATGLISSLLNSRDNTKD